MKKIMLILMFFSTLTVSTVFAQSKVGIIRRARGAARECLNDYNQGWNVSANINEIGICFMGWTLVEVVFIAVPQEDNSSESHPPPLPIVVARVVFGCRGELTSVECY